MVSVGCGAATVATSVPTAAPRAKGEVGLDKSDVFSSPQDVAGMAKLLMTGRHIDSVDHLLDETEGGAPRRRGAFNQQPESDATVMTPQDRDARSKALRADGHCGCDRCVWFAAGWFRDDPASKIDAACDNSKRTGVMEEQDPFDNEEYHRFVAAQVKHCRCCPGCSSRPCDAVLAGGVCDEARCSCDDDAITERA